MSEALKAVILILVLGTTSGANAFGAQGATARPSVRVGGVVRDPAGAPVRGAEVSLTVGRSAPLRVSPAVSADRHSETLTRNQRVPAQAVGFLTQWSRGFGERHALVAGFEAREVRGASDELVYVAGRPSSKVGAGGRERATGFFVEDIMRLSPKLLLTVGGRFDRWRNQAPSP